MNDADEAEPSERGDSPPIFGMFCEDKIIADRLLASVRSLIRREGVTAEQIYHLAKLLFAFGRLPLATQGIGIEVSLCTHHANGERSCQDIFVDGTSFRLGNSRYIIIDPSVGGDSEGETIYEVEVGGFRDMAGPSPMVVMDWLDAFDQRIREPHEKLEICDVEDSSALDWDGEHGQDYWDGLRSDYG
jgi:hypothetical protein